MSARWLETGDGSVRRVEWQAPDIRVDLYLFDPRFWTLSCPAAGLHSIDLVGIRDLEEAKRKALTLVADRLTKMAAYAREAAS